MRSLLISAALLVLVLVQLVFASASLKLREYPHLKCSACHAMTDFIGDRMNETAKVKESVKVSHRLAKGDKQYIDYESSELRAVEIIEETCKGIESKYPLKSGKDGIRTFTKDSGLRSPEFYTKKDRRNLEESGKQLKEVCMEIVEEFDEDLTKLIQKERQLEVLDEKFCKKTSRLCGTAVVDKAIKKELSRKKKFEDREKKRKRKVEEEAEKKKEEEARKAEEEAAKEAAEEEAEKKTLQEMGVDPNEASNPNAEETEETPKQEGDL